MEKSPRCIKRAKQNNGKDYGVEQCAQYAMVSVKRRGAIKYLSCLSEPKETLEHAQETVNTAVA